MACPSLYDGEKGLATCGARSGRWVRRGKGGKVLMSEGMASSVEGGSGRPIPLDAYVCLGLMVLIGSSTATAAKFAVKELPIGLLPMVRFGVAGLVLLPVLWRDG